MATWATVIGPGRSGGGFSRALVDSDFEWLVKACYHEAGSDPSNAFEWGAVLWTLANRWAGKYGHAGETLGHYAQRFCQPINAAQIGLVLGYDRTEADPSGLERARARWIRIRANRARPISCYAVGGGGCGDVRPAPELVDYVLRFMRGEVWDPRYVGLMDWAATWAGRGPEDIPVDLPVRGNVFYREAWARDWNASTVRMTGSAPTSAMRAGLGLALGGLLAAAGVGFLVRRRQRSASSRVWGRPVRRRRR
jgi:hypothetical protein